MVPAATLFPLGILQLYHSVSQGYFDARALKFVTSGLNAVIEWLRFPGDVLFIAGGTLPVLYLAWLGVRHLVPRMTLEEPDEILFAELTEQVQGP